MQRFKALEVLILLFLLNRGHTTEYEVTDKELRTKYKFDDELVKIYNSLRGLMDKTVDHYNTRSKRK